MVYHECRGGGQSKVGGCAQTCKLIQPQKDNWPCDYQSDCVSGCNCPMGMVSDYIQSQKDNRPCDYQSDCVSGSNCPMEMVSDYIQSQKDNWPGDYQSDCVSGWNCPMGMVSDSKGQLALCLFIQLHIWIYLSYGHGK